MATRTARRVAGVSRSASSSASGAAFQRAAQVPPRPSGPTSESPRLRLAAGRTGDHIAVLGFLQSVFHGPSAAEFHAQLDEPGYQPPDRLIVKHGDATAAHLRLARQTIRVGEATLAAARFMDLATAQEFRSRGVATALVGAGQRAAAERGVLVGITRTSAPGVFARHGWSMCGEQAYSTAAPRAVLAELAAERCETAREPVWPPKCEQPLVVRPLRRVELTGVMRLYEARSRALAGWPARSEEYWDWLLSRGACDRVYIASTAPDSASMAALAESIVGYACARQSRVVELVTSPARPDAGVQLFERVCADSREEDGWTVRLDAPADAALHAVLCRAGGRLCASEESTGEAYMAKVLDPLAVLRKLSMVISLRAESAGLRLPLELGLEVRAGGESRQGAAAGVVERYRIKLSANGASVETGGPSRQSVAIAMADLTPLILGYRGAAELAQCGRLEASGAKALAAATAIFPGGLWSRPVWDDLLA